jgi:predicted AAA+ superfamily ATPase
MYTKKINFLYRDIIARIKPWIERDEIIVILGAREVGKTSLLLYLKDEIEKKGEKTFL